MRKEHKLAIVFESYNRVIRKLIMQRTDSREIADEFCKQVFVEYFEEMDRIADKDIGSWLVLRTKAKLGKYEQERKKHFR